MESAAGRGQGGPDSSAAGPARPISDLRDHELLQAAVERKLLPATSVEDGAQRLCDAVFETLGERVALVRTYVVMPFYRLPPRERAFAEAIATTRGNVSRIPDETLVLTLLGTRGSQPEWNDRRKSQGHVAIPLLGARFVEEVPMVAALLRSIGIDLSWLDGSREALTRKLGGGSNGVFFVPEARTEHDERGRLVIPAADFVAREGVRSVFGFGGSYLNGWMMAAIGFARVALSREDAQALSPLASMFKLSTMGPLALGKIFIEGR